MQENYNECLETMYGLRRFGIILGLDTILNILDGLGNPQENFKCIHVAGSNGKGSVASALATILHLAGYKTGLYTSPHLVRFNERICINNRPVSDEDVVTSYKAVKKVHYGEREPTFFEFATAMGFYEFGRQNVEWAVIETGMGGRLDATNIVSPALSVITNISLEHQMYLGDTLEKIAEEKGGIIKEKTPVITAAEQENVVSVLRGIASAKSAPFCRMGEEFRAERDERGTFTYFGIGNTWHDMRTSLQGNYQVDNASLVLAGCEILNQNGAEIPLQSIREGLQANRWPGRLEVVSESPFILLDGAHNLVAARNLASFLSDALSDRDITLVTGILDDKPYEDMLSVLLPVCSKVILTRAKIDRALPPEKLHAVAKGIVPDIEIIPDVGKSLAHAIETASPNAAICIAGSLYVVGEAKEKLENYHFQT
ncbi:folylpolyglutamate synthase/dihydrofolate synthase family protein [Desulfococcaceae bacterium HSG8]|nr:folylpolyglutamate synthase/dihydrofolate synthase family protein [Desulfococcaceae bacterium HSG8]